jgi:hypothetical protein
MKNYIESILAILIMCININNSFAQNKLKDRPNSNIISKSKTHLIINDSLALQKINSVNSAKVEIKIPIDGNFLVAFPPYPIPAKENVSCLIYWDTKLDIKGADMGVYDVNCNKICGKEKVFLNKQTDNSGIVTWNTNAVIKGIYFIQIKHGTATLLIKVIIE